MYKPDHPTVYRTVDTEGELEEAPLGGVGDPGRHVGAEVGHGDTAHEVLTHLRQIVPVGGQRSTGDYVRPNRGTGISCTDGFTLQGEELRINTIAFLW